jgi:putative ABC transport system ATP-binding protein
VVTTETPTLRTEKLGYHVGGQTLLQGVEVSVAPGERLAVVGPSGSGKSTFLRLLNRLLEPTEGSVYLHGQDYRLIPPQTLRRRVGMVMQAPNLFPGTVAENLRFGPRQRGEELQDGYIEELLARVDLPGFARRPVDYLSGGEAQRVSLARTLANEPEILLLDEPTSALDEDVQRDVEGLIESLLAAGGLTCIIVTHDLDQARRMAVNALVLEGGRQVALGPVDQVLGGS